MSTAQWRREHAQERVEYTRQWRKKNPAKARKIWKESSRKRLLSPQYRKKMNERRAIHRRKMRENFQKFKSSLACERCGEHESCCLDFHHKDPKKKDMNMAMLKNYSMVRVMNEAKKCIVLCSNCHRKEHHTLRKKK